MESEDEEEDEDEDELDEVLDEDDRAHREMARSTRAARAPPARSPHPLEEDEADETECATLDVGRDGAKAKGTDRHGDGGADKPRYISSSSSWSTGSGRVWIFGEILGEGGIMLVGELDEVRLCKETVENDGPTCSASEDAIVILCVPIEGRVRI